jgi:hypothetical protein
MRIYKNRKSSGFLKTLERKLSKIDGENGLLETAIPFKEPSFKIDPSTGKKIKYTHCIRIDYLGIAGTILFDRSGYYGNSCRYEILKKLLLQAPRFNKMGYIISLRILLLYPYSIAGYARIQAEESSERSSMEEPAYIRKFNVIEQLDEEIFKQSNLFSIQLGMLKTMQNLYSDLKENPGWSGNDSNKFMIRFCTIDTMMSCIFINNSIFYDVTLLAKKERFDTRSAQEYCPVVMLNKRDHNAFSAFEDHFRYLWELDLTMSYGDVVKHSPKQTISPIRINPPSKIFFNAKASTIQTKNPSLTEEQAQIWKSWARRVLVRYCAELYPTPASESLFVTCSWEVDEDGQSIPNKTAHELVKMLEKDFSDGEEPLLSIRLLKAEANERLTPQLYKAFDDATIGLILITKDIKCEDRFFSKPNVYHELGYFMKALGNERVILVCEENVEKLSNVQDNMRSEFKSGKISLIYPDLVLNLKNICGIRKKRVIKILEGHIHRLDQLILKEILSLNEANAAKRKIEEKINELQG